MGGLQTAHASVIGDAVKAGFQNFVDQSSTTRIATNVAGTPAAGYFYSSIVGRAPIPDISADLRASLGIERIMTQQLVQLQNEFGPNGEPVFSAVNDDRGLIRFVGGWAVAQSNYGQLVYSTSDYGYVEVSFYGTGINILIMHDSTTRPLTVSVDGGAPGASIYPTATSLLGQRYTSTNQVINGVTGLTLGVHTVKFTTGTTPVNTAMYGFEILNANASGYINLNTGTSYIQGQKVLKSAISSIHYGKDSTNTTTLLSNGKGGRIVRYLKSDGTVSEDSTAIPSSPSYLTNADHTNEEVARLYNWREFGASRTDDFSTLGSTPSDRAFTLDDGTTTLVGLQISVHSVTSQLGLTSNSGFITFTFVGTGLDLLMQDSASGGNDSYQYSIDGGSLTAWTGTAGNTTKRVQKVVSGLPYGTHTFKFYRNSASTWVPTIYQFIVYQPKKPAIPATAVELCDYNVMADYSNDTASPTTNLTISKGVLRKVNTREMVYVGSWSFLSLDPAYESGYSSYTADATTSYFEYTFFGTGFNFRCQGGTGAGATSWTVSLDGPSNTNWSAYTSSISSGTTATWTASSGTLSVPTAAAKFALFVSGLPLGFHKIRFQKASGAYNTYFESLDIITPIHSYKSNLYADIQNTLPVGSNSLMDSRKTSMIKESLPAQKAWAQAVGIFSDPTQSSTTKIPLTDMSVTIKTNGGPLKIDYTVCIKHDGVGQSMRTAVYVDGVAVTGDKIIHQQVANLISILSDSVIVPVSAGVHKVDVYWSTSTSTATAFGTNRNLTVQEL
jgi:hypothetical protein